MKTVAVLLTLLIASCGCSQKAPAPTPIPVPTKVPNRVGPHRQVRPPASVVSKKTLTIAVIDTGFGFENKGLDAPLCKFGHKNFTSNQDFSPLFANLSAKVPMDHHGHGTHIAGLIQKYAGTSRSYCLVILKYYDPKATTDNNLANEEAAIQYAINIKADVINLSGGGTESSRRETNAVKKYLDAGGTMIAAAGNEGKDVSVEPYYPAMSDPRVISVGNVNLKSEIVKSSNFGDKVSCFEVGENVVMYDMSMTGTSQATAIATGKFIANQPCGIK